MTEYMVVILMPSVLVDGVGNQRNLEGMSLTLDDVQLFAQVTRMWGTFYTLPNTAAFLEEQSGLC